MGRRRFRPERDYKAEFVDALLADPAGVRAEMQQRSRAFWTQHAETAARQLVEREAEVKAASRQDLPGAWLRENAARRALHDACARAGCDPEALLAAARAKANEQDSERAEANVAQQTTDSREHAEGDQAA